MSYDDTKTYQDIPVEHLWVYDKLILSKKLGYYCGPSGVAVREAGDYIVRPITNLLGMGHGARIVHLEESTDHLPEGYFWCEVFKGRHWSLDYRFGTLVLSVEGFKYPGSLSRFYRWEKGKPEFALFKVPPDLQKAFNTQEWVNVELIGDKIIEVHLRRNPDFVKHDSSYLLPVWRGEVPEPRPNEEFVEDIDGDRIGFIKEKR